VKITGGSFIPIQSPGFPLRSTSEVKHLAVSENVLRPHQPAARLASPAVSPFLDVSVNLSIGQSRGRRLGIGLPWITVQRVHGRSGNVVGDIVGGHLTTKLPEPLTGLMA
jgi:hypothetical protein